MTTIDEVLKEPPPFASAESVCPEPLHDLRRRYGDEIAGIIDAHSSRLQPRAAGPSMQDIRDTLNAILATPQTVDLHRIDPLAHSLLMDPAWRRLRKHSLHALTLEELAECAKFALDHFPRFRKPIAERGEVKLTLSLLAAARTWHAARRNKLLREALSLVFRVEYRRATAIIKTAHRKLHAGA